MVRTGRTTFRRRRYALLLLVAVGTLSTMGAQCAPTMEPVKPPAPSEQPPIEPPPAAPSPTTPPAPPGGVFTASLTGAQEVPPNTSPATGSATVVLDGTETMITVNVLFTGLDGPNTGARIHGPAAPGVIAPVAITLADFPFVVTAGTYFRSLAITAAQVTNLKAGLLYVNITSTARPGGEIRGQLTAVP